MTHKYKGKEYEVLTGKKGGQYFVDDAGKKHYLKSSAPKQEKKKTQIQIQKQEEAPKLKTYICYYREENEDGEMIDDFKEWTEAYSYDEAKDYFEDNYRHNPLVKIDLISRE